MGGSAHGRRCMVPNLELKQKFSASPAPFRGWWSSWYPSPTLGLLPAARFYGLSTFPRPTPTRRCHARMRSPAARIHPVSGRRVPPVASFVDGTAHLGALWLPSSRRLHCSQRISAFRPFRHVRSRAAFLILILIRVVGVKATPV